MAKQIGYAIQDKIAAATISQPFEFNFDTIDQTYTIEVNPVVSVQQRKDFADILWSLYWSPDSEDKYDYRPYMLPIGIRYATLLTYTNLRIEINKGLDRCFAISQYSGVCEAVVAQLKERGFGTDYAEIVDGACKYIELKCAELSDIRAMAAKSQLDLMLEEVLHKVEAWMDKGAAENGGIGISEILSAVGAIKESADEGSLVKNILEYKQKDDGKNGDTGGEV